MNRFTKLSLIITLAGFLSACGETVTIKEKANPTASTANVTPVDQFSDNENGEYHDVSAADPTTLNALLGNYCGTLNKVVSNVSQSQTFTMNLSTQQLTNGEGQTALYAYMSFNSNGQIGSIQINEPMGMTMNDYYNTYGFITATTSNSTLRANAFKVALEIGLDNQNQFQPQNSSFRFRDCSFAGAVCLTDATDVTVTDFHKCN